MVDQKAYEVEIRVSDAKESYSIHRELTTEHATPEAAAREIIGGLYAGIGQRLKEVNETA